MTLETPRSQGWSRLSITLHWLIVLLIIAQYIESDWMGDIWRGWRRNTPVDGLTNALGWSHIVLGTLVLLFAAIRLWDRFTHGRPPAPEGEPAWAGWLSQITHVLIYALLFAMPISGLLAWFGGIPQLAEIHEWLWNPLVALIVVHVAGALAQHFYFRTDVLRRIMKPAV